MTKIILADDSVTIQKVVELTFADQKSQVTAVSDGAAALEKAKAERPDIIISDVIMPGMDGYDLCRQVKSDPDLKTIPFLFLKGTFESFDEDRARECGSDGFIVKPFESQELIGKVNELIAAGSSAPAQAAPPAAEAPPAPPAPAEAPAAAPEPAAPPPPAAAAPPADIIPSAPPKADELTFDLGPEMAADEMTPAPKSEDLSSVEDDLFGMEEDTVPEGEAEQEEDLWSEVSLRDNEAPLIEDNVLEDESFWGTGAEDDGVAAPREPQAASSEALLEDMEEPEILDLTDEAEAPAEPEILDLTDEAEAPAEPEILDLTDERSAPADDATELDIFAAEEETVSPAIEVEAAPEPLLEESLLEDPVVAEPVVAEPGPALTEESVAPPEPEMMDEVVALEPEMMEESVVPPEPEIVEEAVAPPEPELLEEAAAPIETATIEEPAVPVESGTVAAAAPSVAPVSKDELEKVLGARIEEAVRGILGPVIDEAVRKIVEEVAWDVIPDLAEAMIRSEIERIRKRG